MDNVQPGKIEVTLGGVPSEWHQVHVEISAGVGRSRAIRVT
jgi:hypothetical protein